jgi:hypothetical protein
MFNETGGTSGASTGSSGTNMGSAGVSGVVNALQQAGTQSSRQASQPLANVVYGKQAEPNPNAQGSVGGTEQKLPNGSNDPNSQVVDRKTEYARFKDQYKDIFQGEIEAIIKDRFKKYNGLEQQLGQYTPLVNMLMEQYDVKDISDLQRIIEDSSIENIADRDGLTVEQAREVQRLRRENEQLRTTTQSIEQEKIINQRIADWQRQANEMVKDYPDFNLDAWANNDKFMSMITAGVDVRAAYEVCDISNIKSNVAKQMERNVVSNLQARGGKKLSENGMANAPGMTVKASVNALSREDRAEIARRVARGENIQF